MMLSSCEGNSEYVAIAPDKLALTTASKPIEAEDKVHWQYGYLLRSNSDAAICSIQHGAGADTFEAGDINQSILEDTRSTDRAPLYPSLIFARARHDADLPNAFYATPPNLK